MKVKFKGNEITLEGTEIEICDIAPGFEEVASEPNYEAALKALK